MAGLYIGSLYSGPVQFKASRVYIMRGTARVPPAFRYLRFKVYEAPYALEQIDKGSGMIAGNVTIQGVPAGSKVYAMTRRDLRIRRASRSDPVTGKWRIHPLVAGEGYLIVTTDAKTRFNAVVADGVRPVTWEDEE